MAQFTPTVPRIDSDVYLVLCYDGEGSEELRDKELDDHLEYVEKHVDDYLICGPMREPGETKLMGSFFLVAADSAEAAKAIVSADPYVECGMYAEIIIKSTTPAGGRFMGGVIWESADAIRAAAASK